jgi:hypothetical protein
MILNVDYVFSRTLPVNNLNKRAVFSIFTLISTLRKIIEKSPVKAIKHASIHNQIQATYKSPVPNASYDTDLYPLRNTLKLLSYFSQAN